ncbi:non-homologous end-joining DNA ligase [Rugosimonospora africana]|nr:non-homologous end-joining DNA ligase [Rugosimonospora africana]
MLATLGEVPDPPGWGYEFKWDGVRAVVYLDAGKLRVASRNDRDVTPSYPELRTLLGRFPKRRVVFDGEILALDDRGVPSFSLLQQRMHVQAPSAGLLARVPVRLYLFDVLHLGGRPVLDEPYEWRREQLAELGLDDGVATTPPYWADDAGRDLLRAAADLGLEGVVAKRLDSAYRPGARSRAWIKTPLNTTVEVVIAGWKAGGGRRQGMIGSLLLGAYDRAGTLAFVGHVGTGFTGEMLRDLAGALRPLHRSSSPFAEQVPREHARDAHWVEPRLVGEVAYRTLTPDGRLRHPSWRGLRPDREPGEARRDLLR